MLLLTAVPSRLLPLSVVIVPLISGFDAVVGPVLPARMLFCTVSVPALLIRRPTRIAAVAGDGGVAHRQRAAGMILDPAAVEGPVGVKSAVADRGRAEFPGLPLTPEVALFSVSMPPPPLAGVAGEGGVVTLSAARFVSMPPPTLPAGVAGDGAAVERERPGSCSLLLMPPPGRPVLPDKGQPVSVMAPDVALSIAPPYVPAALLPLKKQSCGVAVAEF